MKVLKLCTSDEFAGEMPESQRAYRVAERVISEATGESVETTLRTIWPSPALPDLLDGWLSRYEPDVVLFVVSPFWTTFVSTPLRLQRRFGKLGASVGSAGIRMGANPRLAHTLPMRMARRAAIATMGGDYYFEPATIAETVELCARRVLTRESIGLVVRGPLVALGHHGTKQSLRRAEKRRTSTETLLVAVCERLNVPYVGPPDGSSEANDRARFRADLIHTDAMAHRERGELEGRALAKVWLETLGVDAGDAAPIPR